MYRDTKMGMYKTPPPIIQDLIEILINQGKKLDLKV